MKSPLLFPIVASLLLATYMVLPSYGFASLIDYCVTQLDYFFSWQLTPLDAVFVFIGPWIAYRLLETKENRTFRNQLALNAFFVLAALVFFTFGFLFLELTPNPNPLMPSFIKIQPFIGYWAIWFALGDLLVVAFYLLNKRK